MRTRLLTAGLVVSLAFNLGFVTMTALRCRGRGQAATACAPTPDGCAAHLDEVSQTLRPAIAPLRRQQAAETQRLAGLLAASEPDREAIAGCLDRLSAISHSIHGQVVEAILTHEEAMSPHERAAFADHVRRRLCDPWVSCGMSTCDAPAPETRPEQTGGEKP